MEQGTDYIEACGCQMNEHDSEKMADVLVGNTACIREKVENKVCIALEKLGVVRKTRPQMVTEVGGRMAQQVRSPPVETGGASRRSGGQQ